MEEHNHKRPLSLDWDTIFADRAGNSPPPPELIVKPSADMVSDQQPPPSDDSLNQLKDRQLIDMIRSQKNTLETTGKRLPDSGTKLRASIKRCEEELTRREAQAKRRQEEVEEDQDLKKPRQATGSSAVDDGVSNDLRQENTLSEAQSQSSFASSFVKKMEDDETNCTEVNAFTKEMSHFKHCNKQMMRDNGEPKGRKRVRSSSRQFQFQCPSNLSKHEKSYRATSNFSLRNIGKNLSRSLSNVLLLRQFNQMTQGPGRVSPLFLMMTMMNLIFWRKQSKKTNLLNILFVCLSLFSLKDTKIYFPSRDDPECVEICYTDIDCLVPAGFLTSTIMNFYMRYLQQQASLTNRSLSDYHIFNTYFYKKLKEAVSYKESDRETIFAKFRRWWKGVNIFQKAYVLIPIHEDLHWSLIIICIPNKEDESGPIILHLDSLGLHSSRSVFDNIKSYLIEEKNYLDRERVSLDISIADRIWKRLPRRIEDQVISVPQQKNEYDCGLFVLYFIERFMEEAPERLKKKDLAMFGKRWFKPEEASSLRVKIRELLVAELKNSVRHNIISESSPPSSSAGTAAECVETCKESLDEQSVDSP
ncbi:ubiquitin-like-specific protease 2 isoform X1 [Gastrolobium bilobum]|uniref:ubiquitin-like-specific protease 2 isoform X1 n=1 Tax=Gastrolobium bilobum TaxID=150636 RepID=UPI002AB1132A|nr:ubiquitin-like-specific protease 2 isoform X1 [Gastrolobium bilobum]